MNLYMEKSAVFSPGTSGQAGVSGLIHWKIVAARLKPLYVETKDSSHK